MPLDITYLKTSDGTGDASLMHVTATRLVGATTIAVDTLVGVPAKFIATSGTPNAQGFIDPLTVTNFYGHTSGSNLVIDGFCAGSTDTGNTTSQVVIIKPNTAWADLIATAVTTFLQATYPIGSIYTNATVSTNPATLLGFGTWVAFAVGQVPVGFKTGDANFGTLGQTGGAATVNLAHTHSISTDGSHSHTLTTGSPQGSTQSGGTIGTGGTSLLILGTAGSGTFTPANNTTDSQGSHNHTGATGTNLSSAQSVLQPYVVVYMWKRTA